jgi:3',5'-cyclic AMP phosphodiesterase CpdA
MASLAHWSDLHLGASPAHERRLARAVEQCLAQRVDHVVVTGDLTDGGLERELATFDRLVAPLRAQGRVTVIPGNHDRCGDDVSPQLCDGRRVSVANPPGLHLVRVDTTAPHNAPFASYWSHGDLCQQTLEAIDQALDAAPPVYRLELFPWIRPTLIPGFCS